MANDVQKSAAQQHRERAVGDFRGQLVNMGGQLEAALPKHIPVERFQRVVMTAVQNAPDLLDCDRRSLFNSAMKCAQDGLLPDGREAALVKFKNQVQYFPMVFGLQKKARNSGEVSSILARDVQANDEFDYWVDEDGEHLTYRPSIDRTDIKNADEALQLVRAVFALAKLKDGTIMVEVMSVQQVERIRAISKASREDSPWLVWWGEMAKKTAIRRLSKRLPMSSDLDDLIRRDDELYDLKQEVEPRSLDLSQQAPANQLPPPPPANDGEQQNDGGGQEQAPPSGERPGGSSSAPPSSTSTHTPSDLENDVAQSLLDCRSLADCDGVRIVFKRELSSARADIVDHINAMIDERKAAISAEADDFPGDR